MRDLRPPNGCAGDAFKNDSVGARYAPDSMQQRQHYANGNACSIGAATMAADVAMISRNSPNAWR